MSGDSHCFGGSRSGLSHCLFLFSCRGSLLPFGHGGGGLVDEQPTVRYRASAKKH